MFFHSLWVRVRAEYKEHRTRLLISLAVLIGVVAGIIVLGISLFLPAQGFPEGALITIPEEASVPAMAEVLQEAHLIRSATTFRMYARVSGNDTKLQPGLYVFKTRTGLVGVVSRIARGQHGIASTKVTLTEGMTAADMARTLESVPGFNGEAYERAASTSEGYLFPDTYFVLPGTKPEDMVTRQRARFDEQFASISTTTQASGHTEDELVKMASILEREAQKEEDMRIIAGILWKRIKIGMPLQVDAAFGYARGENGYTPTADDLVSSSKYNTYTNRGLPPTAISNPGLVALTAAATPISTPYFYYLTGDDGLMHYAKTFEEHKRNKALYLRK